MTEEAYIGRGGEELLIRLINRNKEFARLFATCVKKRLRVCISGRLKAVKGPLKGKADIIIFDELKKQVGLSLKTRKSGGRPDDHLDRRWLDEWRNNLDMPKEIYDVFWNGILKKASKKSVDLISTEHHQLIRSFLFLKLDEFLEEIFRKKDKNLKLFAVMIYNEMKPLYIFNIEDIIHFIKENIYQKGVTFSRVIYLGDFLWIQRKAGDSKKITLPKTDPKHPGNQLQVKILPISLLNQAKKALSYCKFELSSYIS